MTGLLPVMLGGALGAGARYLLSGVVTTTFGFPYGTLAVNLIGCFLIAALAESARALGLSPALHLALGAGVLGGFTTYSAFGLETFVLLERGSVLAALCYVGGTALAALFAVWLGSAVTRLALAN